MANNINYGPSIKAKIYNVVLLNLSWVNSSTPYIYTVNNINGVVTNSIIHVIPHVDITNTEYDAFVNAKIIDGGVVNNIVTLKAVGVKPNINIPVRIIVSESIFVESKYELSTAPQATTVELGLIRLANNSEVFAGEDNSKAVTSLGIYNNYIKNTGGTLSGQLNGTIINATTFNGSLVGNVTGDVNGTLTGSVTGNLSGNASTATKLSTTRTNYKTVTDTSVVGELMWKNNGNNHTIFDASNSTTPIGTTCDNSTPVQTWAPTYPTLMGFNGSTTYGVRVDACRLSDTTSAIAGVPVYTGSTNPSSGTRVNVNGYLYATRMYNAVYNDYAECFNNSCMDYDKVKYRIVEIIIGDRIQLASKLSKKVVGVVSSNYAYIINGSEEEIQDGSKIPVGLAGQLYVDCIDKVTEDNLGQFVASDDNGFAKVVGYDYERGTVVGKIIGVDIENNRYKLLLTLQ